MLCETKNINNQLILHINFLQDLDLFNIFHLVLCKFLPFSVLEYQLFIAAANPLPPLFGLVPLISVQLELVPASAPPVMELKLAACLVHQTNPRLSPFSHLQMHRSLFLLF